jgi:hypothetical protein
MTAYYLREVRHGDHTTTEFWSVDDEFVRHIDVVDSSGLSTFRREPGEEVDKALHRIAPWGGWHKLSLAPGEYFPRMARPEGLGQLSPRNPDLSDEFRHSLARSKGQLHAFIQDIEQICRVVHPFEGNLHCYGHETRNILILACTEVEAHWKNILKDNHYRESRKYDNLKTGDYYHLKNAMKLHDYLIQLNYYPWLPPISPFASWSSQDTSKSLSWYHAYNLAKHDREAHFAEATLDRALAAVTACFVLLCGQYGNDFIFPEDRAAGAFFQLLKAPEWLPCEIYVPPFGASLQPKSYPFIR